MWKKVQKDAQQKGAILMSTLGGELKTKQKSRIVYNQKTKIIQDYKTWQISWHKQLTKVKKNALRIFILKTTANLDGLKWSSN